MCYMKVERYVVMVRLVFHNIGKEYSGSPLAFIFAVTEKRMYASALLCFAFGYVIEHRVSGIACGWMVNRTKNPIEVNPTKIL